MMKILVDCRMADASGIGVYTRELMKFFINNDALDVYALIDKDNGLHPDINVDKDRVVTTTVHRFSLRSILGNNKLLKGFDVYFIPFLAIPPIIFNKTRIVSTVHDLCPVAMRQFFGPKTSFSYWAIMLLQCALSHRIIAISKFTRSELRKYYCGLFNKKVLVVENGIRDIKPADNAFEDKPSPEQYGICVGNVKPHKNIFPLIKYLKNKGVSNKLYIIGDIDGFSTKYSTEAFDDLPKNIVFTGKVSDQELHRYMVNAEFMIFPSLYEGFGLPMLEAMQYNLRIFAADIPVFHEISGEAVDYFDPNTFENLDSHLKSLNENINHGLEYNSILNKYTWGRSAEELVGVFCEKDTNSK